MTSSSPLLHNAVTQLVPRLHVFLAAYEKEGWSNASRDAFLLLYMFCWPVFARMGMDGDGDRAAHMARMVGHEIAGDAKYIEEDIPAARAIAEVLTHSDLDWVRLNAEEVVLLLTPPERR